MNSAAWVVRFQFDLVVEVPPTRFAPTNHIRFALRSGPAALEAAGGIWDLVVDPFELAVSRVQLAYKASVLHHPKICEAARSRKAAAADAAVDLDTVLNYLL